VTEADLRELFSKYGKVTTASINTRTHIGFVSFETTQEAGAALEMHDQEVKGHHFFLDYAAKERG
jgi:RNA recognition motif-containing protein